MIKLLKALFFLSILGLIFAFAAGGLAYSEFNKNIHKDIKINDAQIIEIKSGSSLKQIAKQLKSEDLLPENSFLSAPLLFEINARFFNNDAPLKAGEYQILPQMSMNEMIDLFQSGKTYQRSLTIPEGLTVKQILPLIEGAEALEGEITEIPEEGRLLPQTYFYSKGDTRQEIINRMKSDKVKLLNELWENRDESLPFKTAYEALILASIVERETGVGMERAKVAGVFINRLNKGMKLQSDPTVIYPLSDKLGVLDRPLYRNDWKLEDPYNTYFVAGLPPTPIANPGEASLRAVFNPEKHDYLYFVADGTGGHAFSKTLEEHNRNVTKWRKIRDAE